MKKIYILAIGFLMAFSMNTQAQCDTLVYESFNFQSFYDNLVDDVVPPPSETTSLIWYSYDADNAADGSGAGFTGGFQPLFPFAWVDTTDVDLDGNNDNTVIGANSWLSPFGQADNWLITPSFTIRTGDSLYFKSASRQTPRYLDGYQVKISTTDNDDLSFTTTLYTAAEMTTLGSDTTFSTFGFSPGWVQGADGTYILPTDGSSTAAHRGILAPKAISLAAYAGQTVFFAIRHYTYDDFLISFDDFMIRRDCLTGVDEVAKDELGLNVFPNPATDNAQVNYNLAAESNVTITIADVTGKVIATENKGAQASGRHFHMINTAEMANGFYTVSVQTANGRFTTKLIVK